MAFSFFTNRLQNETLALLVDIGSASVGVALVKIEKGNPPHILISAREDISFQEILSSASFLSAMNSSLSKALKTIQQNIKVLNANSSLGTYGTPAHVFCTLSAPWFILKPRHVRMTQQEKFIVTWNKVEELINEDTAQLIDGLKETLPVNDVKIIEKKIIQMRLNGYEIKNPYGQKTSQLDISTTVGISSGKVIESIERKIRNSFHAKAIHFGAFPVAAFSVIRDIFPTEKDFIFLDITGEATDVSFVSNDLFIGTTSFSYGKNFFIREISAELRTVHEEAATLFAMLLRGELDTSMSAKIEAVVKRAEMQWVERFETALKKIAGNAILPNRIFFTTDTNVAPMFSRLISSTKQEFLMSSPVNAQYLDEYIVANFVSFGTKVERDPFIVVEALLAHKILIQHT